MDQLHAPLLDQQTAAQIAEFIALKVYSLWHQRDFVSLSLDPTPQALKFMESMIRLFQTIRIPPSVPTVAMYYISQIKFMYPTLSGGPGSEFRLLVAALMLSVKMLLDQSPTNDLWQQMTDIPLQELNKSEREMLQLLHYNLDLDPLRYQHWAKQISQELQEYQHLIKLSADLRKPKLSITVSNPYLSPVHSPVYPISLF
ncbi:hypothetical protein EDD86DRAFT_213284 [Gorgonomyces haynaldii]|nr:hypothetical protein EDD86DRAFT_213284 [Gorgonomyces haynaldii]